MVLWFLPAEEFSQALAPLFYKVICASAAFVQSEADGGCSQLRLTNRTFPEVLRYSGYREHTWSAIRTAKVVMLMVSKCWTSKIQLRRRSWSPFQFILPSSCCLPVLALLSDFSMSWLKSVKRKKTKHAKMASRLSAIWELNLPVGRSRECWSHHKEGSKTMLVEQARMGR